MDRTFPEAARAFILAWFDARGRRLPFREVQDPYAILVCEIIAQQTQIERAAAKWSAFLARIPRPGYVRACPQPDM